MIKKIFLLAIVLLCAAAGFAQKGVGIGTKAVAPAKQDKIIFAVMGDGTSIEPIAFIESGHLVNTVGGDAAPEQLKAFSELYYPASTKYDLIFGGVSTGKVEVKSNNAESDCGKNIAEVTVQSLKTKLKGNIMALATNTLPKTAASGVRRTPTAAEKTEIETLVRAELTKQKVSAAAQKVLRFQNLTAIDADKDGKVEIVGSYYVNTSTTERALLFLIADKNSAGKFVLGVKTFERVSQKDVMSSDIKDIDQGMYHELLLDTFDYDNDGKSDIFTYRQGFEGSTFNVYHNNAGKWVKVLETSNYHCAY
ncbi:MAG TPA: hypothetical protein VGO50_02700 [Pyrinomonadaceae bacterium]|jgi:hypothetical protein|nr:hypothetical protein [Pyrinomonadaceae bacterium]